MIKKPYHHDHYTYLNQLLALTDEKKLDEKTSLSEAQCNDFLKILTSKHRDLQEYLKKSDEQTRTIILANMEKINRVTEILKDKGKREAYNAALTSLQPSVKIHIKEASNQKDTLLIPLVSLNKVIEEFDGFKNDMTGKTKVEGEEDYQANEFKYYKEEAPELYTFTFSDINSGIAFVARLMNQNMVMLPKGSQDIEDVKLPHAQQIHTKINSEMAADKVGLKTTKPKHPYTAEITGTPSRLKKT